MTSLCLNMIVRNEAAVIGETLASVAHLVHDYVIVDTGSDDDTAGVIRRFFAEHGIDGQVVSRPWRDFGHNRSAALQLGRELSRSDYLFVMDANDLLVGTPDLRGLTHDGYSTPPPAVRPPRRAGGARRLPATSRNAGRG